MKSLVKIVLFSALASLSVSAFASDFSYGKAHLANQSSVLIHANYALCEVSDGKIVDPNKCMASPGYSIDLPANQMSFVDLPKGMALVVIDAMGDPLGSRSVGSYPIGACIAADSDRMSSETAVFSVINSTNIGFVLCQQAYTYYAGENNH